jgi:hypothetical protein
MDTHIREACEHLLAVWLNAESTSPSADHRLSEILRREEPS